MQSEFLKCSSIVKGYTTIFYSDGNLAHSGTDGGLNQHHSSTCLHYFNDSSVV